MAKIEHILDLVRRVEETADVTVFLEEGVRLDFPDGAKNFEAFEETFEVGSLVLLIAPKIPGGCWTGCVESPTRHREISVPDERVHRPLTVGI